MRFLGHRFITDNRPGASGMIGAELVAKAPPDGYTLLMVPATLALRKRIELTGDDALARAMPSRQGIVEVALRDGRGCAATSPRCAEPPRIR
jgi:hypothetical protein